ncbi:hypothetical protein CP532_7054 [Ophiocordyceps camponoti-leonardi (nom. inval.)]|nr:hypothetical protein CP532_7054 [Ophiocordyceps camponoti-leonardi (nom. inval.)]
MSSAPPGAALDDNNNNTSTTTLANLIVTLRQSSLSPPTVRVTVTNKNPHPVTIVSYQSPLDNLALALGSLTITPTGSSQPVELPIIRAKRVWPPPEDSLIVVKAGSSAGQDIALEEPHVPVEKLGGSADVVLRGRWMAVWPRARAEISKADIENASGTALSGGEYVSNTLKVKIK